jgi:cytochrome P450
LLRWEPPAATGLSRRYARDTVEIGGVEVAAKSPVTLLLGAANHDPARFPDPDRFDAGRPNHSESLVFGRGVHYCDGAKLIRSQLAVALPRLLERLPGLQLAGEPTRSPVMPTGSYRRLEVTLPSPVAEPVS